MEPRSALNSRKSTQCAPCRMSKLIPKEEPRSAQPRPVAEHSRLHPLPDQMAGEPLCPPRPHIPQGAANRCLLSQSPRSPLLSSSCSWFKSPPAPANNALSRSDRIMVSHWFHMSQIIVLTAHHIEAVRTLLRLYLCELIIR